ncbi:hypothetical protein CDD82_4401 [Ophiocordyceps australis]|uniref:chitinase n=1 Tax=Ophiocordyceps australis TaxID=1399860 RepID=A0A2C5Z6A8_9HYPO|nr:hypothetical protein CDD82_4401 [Ophiocordyceps australis]
MELVSSRMVLMLVLCMALTTQSARDGVKGLDFSRRIGFYDLEAAAQETGCGGIQVENLQLAPLTHLVVAHASIGTHGRVSEKHAGLMYRASLAKLKHPSLGIVVSVKDDGGSRAWMLAATSAAKRQVLIQSMIDLVVKYGFSGVDLDWSRIEMQPRLVQDHLHFLHELRHALDSRDARWTLSVTLTARNTWLAHFPLKGIQHHANWINLKICSSSKTQTKDDAQLLLGAHMDMAQVTDSIRVLQHNGIDAVNVVVGMPLYGHAFLLDDRACIHPDGTCKYAATRTDSCSPEPGTLSYAQLVAHNASQATQEFHSSAGLFKYTVLDDDTWVSYDDAQTWAAKLSLLASLGVGGIALWSLNNDNSRFDALSALVGDFSSLQLHGPQLRADERIAVAEHLAAFTGQDCFVTARCSDGSRGQRAPEQVCPRGFLSLSTAHTPLQAPRQRLGDECGEQWYRHVCCPRSAMPKNCAWMGCGERCAGGKFELNSDRFKDARGREQCERARRPLCCDATPAMAGCRWTSCQGPLAAGEKPACPRGLLYQTHRLDDPDGSGTCGAALSGLDAEQAVAGGKKEAEQDVAGGKKEAALAGSFKSALCCPDTNAVSRCSWAASPPRPGSPCLPQPCQQGGVLLATALQPAVEPNCSIVEKTHRFNYCCEPHALAKKPPVDPANLFQKTSSNGPDDELAWAYTENPSNNDQSHVHHSQTPPDHDAYGHDAYGFVMLDGPSGSIDNTFAHVHTIVRPRAGIGKFKRSAVTTNRTLIDSVFDAAQETLHIYCNYPADSPECQRLWLDGARDTVIRLPHHIGLGPFARVVSIADVSHSFSLPTHHLHHRSLQGLATPVYRLTVDYSFDQITPKRANEPVNIRIDYTNLLGYWDEMTDARPASRKRSGDARGLDWHARVNRAIARDRRLRKRAEPINVTVPMSHGADMVERERDVALDKRWWGAFVAWIRRLTTVKKSNVGVLPLGWKSKLNLLRMRQGCSRQTFSASLDIDLEASIGLDMTYAYYLSGSFIPPSIPDAYAYLGMEPHAYAGIRIAGRAQMQYRSERKQLIDTITYPGLAIKGIVSIGPTFDLYGQIIGKITVSGQLHAGAHLQVSKAEVYWPQDAAASKKYQKLLGLDSTSHVPAHAPNPTLDAALKLDASLDISLQPQASLGIKVGGGVVTAGKTIMDAQLSGYLVGTLSFQASTDVDTSTKTMHYSYGVYLLFNLGYSARAHILGLVDWAMAPREAFVPPKQVNVIGPVRESISWGRREAEQVDMADGDLDIGISRRGLNASVETRELFGRSLSPPG